MTITSRDGFKDYCLRRLGFPVIKINIDDDQLEDRVEDAFAYFRDYHYDATEKVYIAHRVTDNDKANRYIDLSQISGIANTIANSNVVTGTATNFSSELAVGTTITIGTESYDVSNISNNAVLYANTVFTSSYDAEPITNTSDANLIWGVTRIFPIASTNASMNMFDLRYQLRLHELYDFTSTSYINFVLTQQHLRTLDMLFSGEETIRFNRHLNRVYIDFDWGNDINSGEYLIIEATKAINPDLHTRVYNDRYLKALATAYIKEQWGSNLKKFNGVALVGGITLNGQQIFDEAQTEIAKLEEDIMLKFQEPPQFLVM